MTSLITYAVSILLPSHPIGQSKAIISCFLRALSLSPSPSHFLLLPLQASTPIELQYSGYKSSVMQKVTFSYTNIDFLT